MSRPFHIWDAPLLKTRRSVTARGRCGLRKMDSHPSTHRIDLRTPKKYLWIGGPCGSSTLGRWLLAVWLPVITVSLAVPVAEGSASFDHWVTDPNETTVDTAVVPSSSSFGINAAGSGDWVTDPNEAAVAVAVAPYNSGAVATAAASVSGAFVTDPGEAAVAVVSYNSGAVASTAGLDADPVASASSLAEARFIFASHGQGALSGKVDEISACAVC